MTLEKHVLKLSQHYHPRHKCSRFPDLSAKHRHAKQRLTDSMRGSERRS
jgi:hypothetical protein